MAAMETRRDLPSEALDARKRLEEAREAVKARDEILVIVAHDLQNPLQAVVTAARLLELRLSQDQRNACMEPVATIQRAAVRMRHLLEDILDLGSVEAHQLRLKLRPEPPAELVSEALKAHLALGAESGIHLASFIEDDLPPVRCDRERVFQVFTNLITNAFKFSSPGSSVTVSAGLEGDGVRFSVSDQGAGIKEADLPHVFDRYWRGPRSTRQSRGLGLFIVKGIVEAHSGSVAVESSEGNGSTFRFLLPFAAH